MARLGSSSVYGDLLVTGEITGKSSQSVLADSATILATARTVAMTGDVTWTSAAFNGSTNVTGTATLANSGVVAGTYGKVTVDAKGRVTSGTSLIASDVPSLDASKITSGVIDAARLPSFVDDVLEFANLAGFPGTGETGKIYVAIDTSKTYRWSGSAYVYITSGAVDSVAGKTGVVSLVKADVGLGSVDNTSDASKPVSTAQQTALNLKANLASPTFTGTVTAPTFSGALSGNAATVTNGVYSNGAYADPVWITSLAKSKVGLGSADNTSDAAKPVSTAQQTALDLKANLASPTFTGTVGGITKSMVGLASADNTSDAAKPVSTAQQTALNLKANLASPVFTGNVTGLGVATGTSFNAITGLSSTAPVVAGTATVGTGVTVARADHVHPVQTTVTGNAGSATVLATARTINGTSFNGAANIDTAESLHSSRDFPNGTLITTNINYAPTAGDPWVLEIEGNSYSPSLVPFDIKVQGYVYSDTMINMSGISNGTNITGMVLLNVGGNLCFWFPNQSYWQGFNVKCYAANAGRAVNRVTGITHVAKPVGTKEVTVSDKIRQSLHSSNFNTYAPTLTGTGASGTWGISVSGNAATVSNGVYTTGSYADPSWLSSVASTKISGTMPSASLAGTYNIAITGNAATATNGVVTTGSYSDPAWLTLTKAKVGLGSVDNTSDAAKPVSTAQQTALDLKANLASPTFTGTVSGVTKAMVGLSSVDNTTDASKPVSTAQQTALDLKANLASPTFTGTVSGITKTMVGLGSVDNTTDAAKPVSTAQQTALNLKANLASPTFTGTVTSPAFSGALTGNASTATSVVRGAGNIAEVTAPGAGVYNRHVVYANSTEFAIESALATDAIGGAKLPIDFTWRGGYPVQGGLRITGPTSAALGGNTVLHATNYNSYSPTLTGTGASGTWVISISGNAATATNGVVTTGAYSDPSWLTLTKGKVGLGSVDNTADSAKPVSTAQQTALNLKANIASPVFTGNVTGLGVATGTSFNSITGLSSTTPAAAGTAAVGVGVTAARADHVHQIQTTVTGNAGTATTLATARAINGISFNGSADIVINAVDSTARIASSEKGAANGVATLDAGGLVPAGQLPSYVDDVLEYANLAGFPVTGETGKIYVAVDTNKTYRWSGTVYVYITSGAVDSVAGKTGVVALVKGDVGLGSVDNTSDAAKPVSTAQQTALNLKADLASPTFTGTVSGITKTMVGLGSVDNTTDAAKPVSTAQQTALNLKANLASPTFTGTVTSPAFAGALTGNASTATNVAWSGVTSKPTTLSGFGVTDFLSTNSTGSIVADNTLVNGIHYTSTALLGAPDGGLISQAYGSTWQGQIFIDYRTGQIATRGKNNNVWQSWRTQLDSGNFNSYAPTLTGTGASGSWGISVTGSSASTTGNAATVTNGLYSTGSYSDPSWLTLTKGKVGLGSVDNTSDAAKPVSTAQQTALNLKANLASPVFTGNVTGLGVATGTSFNAITGLSAATPLIAGTAAVGTGVTVARADHVHPVQTTVSGNAGTATTLATTRAINGTSFNGSADITTANWGTARTLTLGSTGKSVNGSANVSWSLAEIGAAATSHTHTTANVTGLDAALSGKQATLVSGTNIKTLNGESVLGAGDIKVSGSSYATMVKFGAAGY